MVKTLVLYGSETGMSEELAQKLSYSMLHWQIPHLLTSFEDISLPKFQHLYTSGAIQSIIVVSSTTGQGELPTSIKKAPIWSFLKRKDLPNNFFKDIDFYFLGVGDSLYLKFQHAIRVLKLRFIDRLGGNMKLKMDVDVSGMKGDGNVEMVMPQFLKTIKENFGENNKDYIKDSVYIPMGVSLESTEVLADENSNISNEVSGSWMNSSVLINDRITAADHFQDVRCIQIENRVEFEPGDTVSILPCNEDHVIAQFLDLQPHLKPYLKNELKIVKGDEIETTNLHYLLKHKIDLTSVPNRLFFMKIWNFQESSDVSAADTLSQHKQKLYEFGHLADDYDYLEYVYRPRRSILEILYDFYFIKLPLKYLLDLLPIIRPRQYSISSSFCSNHGNIELTVAVVEYETQLFKKRVGLCSSYLKNLKEGQEIQYQINKMKLFDKLEPFIIEGVEDILLISPGVGIAPIKSFILEDNYKDFNKTLYFGSRFSKKDKLYSALFEQLSEDSSYSLSYKCCFSREEDNIIGSKRIKHVQDLLWQESEFVYDMVFNKKCIIYLCGSAGQMPTQVKLTLIAILQKYGVSNSTEYINLLIKTDRFIQETW